MTTIILRRGTSAEWTAANPILEDAEPGYETDTQKQKIGDGVTHWNDLEYTGLSQDAIVFPVLSVQGDTGDVRLSLSLLDGVQLELFQTDDSGAVIEPGPTEGEFLGWDVDGIARNIPVNLDTLGAYQKFEPKDPNSKYRVYGYAISRGGTLPPDLPDVAWIADENNPELSLIEDVYYVDGTSAEEILPSYLDYNRAILRLGVADTKISLPAAPTVGAVTYDISIDQDPTVGSRTVTWSTNIRWDKVGGSSAAPVLETAVGSRNRFRFSGTQGRWECMGRIAYGPGAVAAAAPTWVGAGTGNNGASNTSTSVAATYPSVVNSDDVCIMCLGLSGNVTVPDDAAISALGFTLIEGPITNSDTQPSLRSYLYKKKLAGTEDGATLTIPWTGGNGRGILTLGVWRGADFDRVNYVPSRDTTQDTDLEYPAITPSVDNSVFAAFNAIRYGLVAGLPAVNMPDATWTERADHYEGRVTDGSIVQFGGHLATKVSPVGHGTEHPATLQATSIPATFAGFIVSVPPVDV